MTTATPDLTAALRTSWATLGIIPPRYRAQDRSPAAFEDAETLRRSLGGLSTAARRAQRTPGPLVVDEYGYDRQGRYYAAYDGGSDE